MVDHAEHGNHHEWPLSSPLFLHRRITGNDFSDKPGGFYKNSFGHGVAHAAGGKPEPQPVSGKHLDRWGHDLAAGGSIDAVYGVGARNSEHCGDMVGDAQRRNCIEWILYRTGGHFIARDYRIDSHEHG